jgi:hypothetical protein
LAAIDFVSFARPREQFGDCGSIACGPRNPNLAGWCRMCPLQLTLPVPTSGIKTREGGKDEGGRMKDE